MGLKRPFRAPSEEEMERLIETVEVTRAHILKPEGKVEGRDQLTGLPDRGCFYRDLSPLVSMASRFRFLLCLLFIDLNNFKCINDTFGHETETGFLISQVHDSRRHVSGWGNVCRYGGDEVAIPFRSGLLSYDLYPEDLEELLWLQSPLDRVFFPTQKRGNVASIPMSQSPLDRVFFPTPQSQRQSLDNQSRNPL